MNAEDREIIADMKGELANTRWLLNRLEGEAIEADHLRVLANEYLDAKESAELRVAALEAELAQTIEAQTADIRALNSRANQVRELEAECGRLESALRTLLDIVDTARAEGVMIHVPDSVREAAKEETR